MQKIKVATSANTGVRNCPPDSSTAMGSNPAYIKDLAEDHHKGNLQLNGPDDRIRTCGILLPKQALYQTEPHPGIKLKEYKEALLALLRYPISSSVTAHLRQLSTAATRSGRLTPPLAALPSLPQSKRSTKLSHIQMHLLYYI